MKLHEVHRRLRKSNAAGTHGGTKKALNKKRRKQARQESDDADHR